MILNWQLETILSGQNHNNKTPDRIVQTYLSGRVFFMEGSFYGIMLLAVLGDL